MNAKIKIVFGVNDFLVGGMQWQFSELVRYFDREKFDVSLITLFQFREKEDFYAALPVDLPVYRLSFTGWWDIREWWKLYRLLRMIRPHIVVSSLFYANTAFRILSPFLSYVSIAREHNTYIHKPRWQQYIDRILAHVSYRIVAVSKTVASFTAAQEGIAAEKFVVIHNGIDLARAQDVLGRLPEKEGLRKELGLPPTRTVFLNVARLTSQKNHKLLLEGFAAFHATHPTSLLLIVGGGSLRPALEAQARHTGLTEDVIFFGMRSDVWRFYKAADALVSTSLIEGFSNVYLEALAAGLPVISTLTAGTDELLVDGLNGYRITESTPKAVEEALTATATVVGKGELTQGARETAKRFSIRQTVERYESLFMEAYSRKYRMIYVKSQ
ncbi:hypothetical protein A3G63_02455 [Candidatus Kaiserbacteria bacterium RIFCSPLOWO2_12_FULL_52_8]|uniref:Glycosyltransferase subfamily 4-like N-terminal domain-containing protein n=1 Tax=Candidatus Kaiserbacteria bacterium RIFCSPHIGHO2_01_FULL_53_31 TaxID=1798481 RepID=A0A1F6CGE0_9BACT|nr:MAG: hypothetical protein A2678_01575 [Candidatus Kaiserbacteria bacterium RIFCSPHIGHO2_01_FULL_53_31]OGG92756.1 MAG: hypothetical protein A3G63_02455 [Candidatus Kaiserbacteria bacterium RIFCSPLOWO2_12_FULL_52_8]